MSTKTLLKPAKEGVGQVYAKVGIYGEAGSGKSFTSSIVAIGLHKLIKSKKPIAYMDTETGSDFTRILFKKENVDLLVAKERTFKSLLTIMEEAKNLTDILIVDSITHPYQDMMQSYLDKTGKKRLAFQDWNVLKPTFRQFTDAFLVAKFHIIVCGRSQGIWDYFENEEGKMELYQVGTKMKVEKEMGYEPSLLVEMERIYEDKKPSGKWLHRANFLKDRNADKATTLDGKAVDDPTFETFLPHILALNLTGKYNPINTAENSQEMFQSETGKPEWKLKEEQKEIVLDEIKGEMVKVFPSSTSPEQKRAIVFLQEFVFGIKSWKAIEQKSLEDLKLGLEKIKIILSTEALVEELRKEKPDKQLLLTEIPF